MRAVTLKEAKRNLERLLTRVLDDAEPTLSCSKPVNRSIAEAHMAASEERELLDA